jgi:hypothetical protein
MNALLSYLHAKYMVWYVDVEVFVKRLPNFACMFTVFKTKTLHVVAMIFSIILKCDVGKMEYF